MHCILSDLQPDVMWLEILHHSVLCYDYLLFFPVHLSLYSFNCNYHLRYGVHDMDGSAKRIYDAASRTPEDHITIFLAHNGPTGIPCAMIIMLDSCLQINSMVIPCRLRI